MTFRELKSYWRVEVVGDNKSFSWGRLLRRAFSGHSRNYLFWFRFSQYLYAKDGRVLRSWAKKINKKMILKYGVEIMLGVQIGPGMKIIHPRGIVIWQGVVAGSNLTIRQNTTIGTTREDNKPIVIGNNVDIGANCCIVGDGLIIGDDVRIGAMSFVNCNIPPRSTFVTVKESRIISRLE